MYWVAKYLKRSCSIVDYKLSYLLLYLLLCCFFFGLFFSFLSKLFVMCCLPYLKESYICKIKKYKVKKFADSFLNWDLLTVADLTEIFRKVYTKYIGSQKLKEIVGVFFFSESNPSRAWFTGYNVFFFFKYLVFMEIFTKKGLCTD